MDKCQGDWMTLTGGDFTMTCQRRNAVGRTDIEERCRAELDKQC